MAVATEPRLAPHELARIYSRIDGPMTEDGCWPWNGTLTNDNQPVIRIRGKTWCVRTLLFYHFAPKAEDMVLCRTPRCLNPLHKRR